MCAEKTVQAESDSQKSGDEERDVARLPPDNIDLLCESKSLTVPREKLIAYSPYFKVCLASGRWGESNITALDIADVKLPVLKKVINFIKTEKIKINYGNIEEILVAADRLGVDSLVTKCLSFLEKNLVFSTCLKTLTLADLVNDRHLTQMALRHVLRNIDQPPFIRKMCKLNEFSIIQILSVESAEKTEDFMFELALSWLETNKENVSSVFNVLKHIRFPFVSPTLLNISVSDRPYLNADVKVRQLILKALWYKTISQENPDCITVAPQQRRGSSSRLPLFVSDNSAKESTTYDVTCAFSDASSSFDSEGITVASHNGRIYTAGGSRATSNKISGCNSIATVDRSRHVRRKVPGGEWEEIESLKTPRSHCCLLSRGRYIYAIGGNKDAKTPTIERYMEKNKYPEWVMVSTIQPDLTNKFFLCTSEKDS